jgi:hypothetical protein
LPLDATRIRPRGGVSQEVADLLAGLTGVERRIALLWRSHVVTVHFL